MQMRKKLYIFKHFAKSKKLFFCQCLSFSVWFLLKFQKSTKLKPPNAWSVKSCILFGDWTFTREWRFRDFQFSWSLKGGSNLDPSWYRNHMKWKESTVQHRYLSITIPRDQSCYVLMNLKIHLWTFLVELAETYCSFKDRMVKNSVVDPDQDS
jgi:hypothetical protein